MPKDKEEEIIVEGHSRPIYCALGFIAVPLWLGLMDIPKVRGYSLFERILMGFENLLDNPYMLGATVTFELLMLWSFCKISRQRLILTATRIVFRDGLLRPEWREIPLERLESICQVVYGEVFAKRMGCSAVKLKPKGGKALTFAVLTNAREFVELTSRQMAIIRAKEPS